VDIQTLVEAITRLWGIVRQQSANINPPPDLPAPPPVE
jgi:hypothetical protein